MSKSGADFKLPAGLPMPGSGMDMSLIRQFEQQPGGGGGGGGQRQQPPMAPNDGLRQQPGLPFKPLDERESRGGGVQPSLEREPVSVMPEMPPQQQQQPQSYMPPPQSQSVVVYKDTSVLEKYKNYALYAGVALLLVLLVFIVRRQQQRRVFV
jgi:hypothetical protein